MDSPSPTEMLKTSKEAVMPRQSHFANDLLDKADITPTIYEITSQKKFDKLCTGTTICAISFLPNIYETTAKDREALLAIHSSVAKANRKQRLVNFWSEAGN